MLRNLIYVEESHLLTRISPDRSDLSEPMLSSLAREGRLFGFGTVLLDQVSSLIPVAIVANMNTRIALRLISGPDIKAVAESMGLPQDQRDFLSQLPVQVCVMRNRVYPRAFVIHIPDVRPGTISEGEIQEATGRAIAGMSWKERCQPVEEKNAPEPETDVVPKGEQDYLIFCADNPEVPSSLRDRRYGVGGWKGNALRAGLTKRGYIETMRIPTGRKGGNITLVSVTPAGYEYLQRIKAKIRPLAGVGGFLHRVGQLWIKQWYERTYPGCEAVIEEQVRAEDRYTDVGVTLGKRRVAVELLVEGIDKEAVNITKVLTSGNYQELVLVTTDEDNLKKLEEMAQKIRQELGTNETEVGFKLLGEYLPEKLS